MRRCCGRAVCLTAATTQPIRSHRQRAQGIGAALVAGARVVGTYRGGQGVQAGIYRMGVGGDQPTEYLGQAIRVAPERDFAIAAALPATPHRIMIGPGHDPVDVSAKSTLGYPRPPATLTANSASTAAST